jgi:tetratricopeptide (TPR) repeat protein
MPVSEAMACDLPVIVTRGGATDDFCVEETAYFVDADRRDVAFNEETAGQTWMFEPQADSLVTQMNHVLANPEEAVKKGKLGGDHVRENLTWKQASDRALERLEAICAEPIRRTITLSGLGSLGAATVVDSAVDCLVLTSGSVDRDLANHNLERYTSAQLVERKVDLLRSELSIGGALNARIADLKTDYVLLLGDDVVVTEGWIDPLLKVLSDDPSAGIVVPTVPNGQGEQGVEARYGSKKKALQKFARRRRTSHDSETVEVNSIETSCVLIRRELLVDLGGFEATFQTSAFIDDFVRRSRQRGYRTICAIDSFVHRESSECSIEEVRERKAASHLAEGDRLRLEGEHDDALVCYREALDLKDDYVEGALVCSAVLLEMDRPEEAAEPFEVLVEKYPDSARLQNYLGRCLFKASKIDEAKALFEHALELMPAFAEARGNLAVLHWEQGRLDEAVEHMIAAAELAPNDPDTLFNIGMIYAQLGQGTEAIEALTSYLAVLPEDNDSRVHLAALLIDNGRENDGLTQLEHVLSEVPDHADAARVLRQLEMLVATNEARGNV